MSRGAWSRSPSLLLEASRSLPPPFSIRVLSDLASVSVNCEVYDRKWIEIGLIAAWKLKYRREVLSLPIQSKMIFASVGTEHIKKL